MAIDPNLVSIIPASELPTGVPTTAGQFFFYEGNEMKKSPMTEIYELVSGSQSIGTITPSSTIPTEGNVWGFAGEGTYPNAGNITVATGKFAILSRVSTTWSKVEVAVLDNFSAVFGTPSASLATALADPVASYLLPNIYETSSAISVNNNTHIVGVPGKTVIKYNDNWTLLNLENKKNISFENIIFDGGNPADNNLVMTASDVKNLVGKGTQNAVVISGTAENISFINCIFKNFSGFGIFINQPGFYKMGNNISLRGCKFIRNYLGVVKYERAEYNFDSQIECYQNRIGVWIDGGNNFISTSNFTENSVGVVITGESNNNDTHGGLSNCAINHNKSFNLFANLVNNGFTFNGCHFFDGKIHLENSVGINIQGGIIDGMIEEVSPRENSKNIISNNIFFNSYHTNNAGLFQKISMKNNAYANGGDSSGINNNV